MSFTQLNPPIPMFVIGKGEGYAIAAIDYGPDYDLMWTVIITDTGEIWTATNKEIRGVVNWTLGRGAGVKHEQS